MEIKKIQITLLSELRGLVKKQMLQAADTDLFNSLVLKAYNRECQNLLFPLHIKLLKISTLKVECNIIESSLDSTASEGLLW